MKKKDIQLWKDRILAGALILSLALVVGNYSPAQKAQADGTYTKSAISINLEFNELKEILGLIQFGGTEELSLGASGTRFPNGLSADSTSPSAGQVRGTTFTSTGAATLGSTVSAGGLVTLNAGQLKSYTNSTSTTATTQTLEVGDVLNYDTVSIVPNTGDLTLTFFASSTASTLVPTAGDMQETCIQNATTTAGIDITFAAGTGIDLKTSSSSPSDLTIQPTDIACFKFIREVATASTFDITANMTGYVAAD